MFFDSCFISVLKSHQEMKKMELSEKNVKHLLYISCVCEVNRIINIKKKKYILNKIQ